MISRQGKEEGRQKMIKVNYDADAQVCHISAEGTLDTIALEIAAVTNSFVKSNVEEDETYADLLAKVIAITVMVARDDGVTINPVQLVAKVGAEIAKKDAKKAERAEDEA